MPKISKQKKTLRSIRSRSDILAIAKLRRASARQSISPIALARLPTYDVCKGSLVSAKSKRIRLENQTDSGVKIVYLGADFKAKRPAAFTSIAKLLERGILDDNAMDCYITHIAKNFNNSTIYFDNRDVSYKTLYITPSTYKANVSTIRTGDNGGIRDVIAGETIAYSVIDIQNSGLGKKRKHSPVHEWVVVGAQMGVDKKTMYVNVVSPSENSVTVSKVKANKNYKKFCAYLLGSKSENIDIECAIEIPSFAHMAPVNPRPKLNRVSNTSLYAALILSLTLNTEVIGEYPSFEREDKLEFAKTIASIIYNSDESAKK